MEDFAIRNIQYYKEKYQVHKVINLVGYSASYVSGSLAPPQAQSKLSTETMSYLSQNFIALVPILAQNSHRYSINV